MKKFVLVFILSAVSAFGMSAQTTTSTHPGIDTVLLSGTLPVMYIDTENGQVIDQKETYLQATYYLDNMGLEGIESIGADTARLPLQIRGRGNASWSYDKKPYKLKFGSKTAILGMPKHKHFALLAHTSMQEYYQERVSFKLAEMIDLGWVPRSYPVEVVLNGRSIGFYSLCESVKIDKNRINIYEQEDLNTDSTLVDGGWLVEIDNYDDEFQIKVEQPNGHIAKFTHKVPEVFSDLQQNWMVAEFEKLTEAIYCEDKTSQKWEEYIDITALARYYLIQELTNNYDAFTGSTYLHKDLGGKWIFGPIWDSGWTFGRYPRTGTFVWERREYAYANAQFVWVEELWKFPRFREAVLHEWQAFEPKIDGIYDYIDSLHNKVSTAINLSYDSIWPQYKPNWIDLATIKDNLKQSVANYSQWFFDYMDSEVLASIDEISAQTPAMDLRIVGEGEIRVESAETVASVMVFDVFGRRCSVTKTDNNSFKINEAPGLYVIRVSFGKGKVSAKTVRI